LLSAKAGRQVHNLKVVDLNPTSQQNYYVKSETERLPAGAGRISDVIFQVLKYDVFRDGAVCG